MGQTIILLVVGLLIFLVLRELVMWYWKINERINLLTKISGSLSKIETALDFLAINTEQKNREVTSGAEAITNIKISNKPFDGPKFQTNKIEDKK